MASGSHITQDLSAPEASPANDAPGRLDGEPAIDAPDDDTGDETQDGSSIGGHDKSKGHFTPTTSTTTAPATEPTNDVQAVLGFTLGGNPDYWAGERVLQHGRTNFEINYRINYEDLDQKRFNVTTGQLCHYDVLRPEVVSDNCYRFDLRPRLSRRQSGDPSDSLTRTLAFEMPTDIGALSSPALYLRLDWTYNRSDRGTSTSGLFTKLNEGESVRSVQGILEMFHQDAARNDHSLWDDNTPNIPDSVQAIIDGDGEEPEIIGETASRSGTLAPTATGTSEKGAETVDSSSGSSSSSGGGGGGGLSTGAIAGIGVGAGIVVLAIVGALVWFFCVRNRRRKSGSAKGPYSAPDGQLSAFMVTKETAAHVTESPHSPYSDDGSLARATDQQQQPQAYPAPTAYGGDDREAQPYSDAPAGAATTTRSGSRGESRQGRGDRPASRSGARSGTPAGNVSHLIEDGMTEEDIRRLEEEERALDDAIERAGRQGRS